jgi:hypothetical protein
MEDRIATLIDNLKKFTKDAKPAEIAERVNGQPGEDYERGYDDGEANMALLILRELGAS